MVRHLETDEAPFWVDARNLRTLDEVLVAALATFDADLAPGDSLSGALGRAVDGRSCLLVLDGLDLDLAGAGQALQTMVETTSDARVVVTARTTAG